MTIITSGCVGNNNTGNSLAQNAVTINNSGNIPIFKDNQTTSEIYVHNYSTVTIKGISYSVSINTDGAFKPTSSFLSLDSINQCASIAANSSCSLKFTTPKAGNQEQASALITLKYQLNGQTVTFNQVLNFKNVAPTSKPEFASGVNISSFGHNTGYGTVYIYGNGNYGNLKVNSDKYAIRLHDSSNLKLNAQTGNSWVQAVEVTTLITKKIVAANLSLNSNNSAIATTAVMVSPIASGGILVASQVPVINTANTINPAGSLILTNGGNATLTLGSSSAATSGITNLSGCTSGTTLAVGSSCTMTFNVLQSNGSSNITVNYTGNTASSITQTVTWYNSMNGTLLGMNYNSPILLSIASPTSVQVTMTNIGGYNLTNLTPTTPTAVGGASATGTISYPAINSCQGITLNVESSCSFILNVSDTASETSKQLLFGIQGNYINSSTQTYLRYGVLDYSVTSNTFLYLPGSSTTGDLSAYIVNPESASLTQMTGSPFTAGVGAQVSAITSDSKYLYVVNDQANSIWAYSINATTGVPTHFATYSTPEEPLIPVITPNGKFLYVGTWVNDTVYAFSINSSTGALTQVGSYKVGQVEIVLADSTSSYLYVSSTNQKIYEFKINQSNGTLTSNGTINAGYYPQDMVISPNDKFLYANNIYDKTISAYTINQSNGTLSLIGTYSVSGQPWTMYITPNNAYIYVTINTGSIIAYAVNQTTGALTLIGSYGSSIGGNTSTLAITPDSKYLYAAYSGGSNDGTVAFSIGSTTGTLTQLGISYSDYTYYPYIDSVNGFLYTTGYGIASYIMNSDGTLTSAPGTVDFNQNYASYLSIAYTNP